MNPKDFNLQLKVLQDEYSLSTASAIAVLEAVAAFTKYDNLPPASKDCLQSICDIYLVDLLFCIKTFPKKSSQMILAGISKGEKGHRLYSDLEKLTKFEKKATWYKIGPDSNCILSEVEGQIQLSSI